MSLTYAEPRLAPLGNTFLTDPAQEPRAQKRSHSFSGYVPYHRWQSFGATEPEPRTRRSGGASQGAAECACVASDASTSVPKSSALEVVSSPTECERAGIICEESTPELWATDSDSKEHVWLSCGRGGASAPVPAGAGPPGDFGAPSQIVATTLSGRPRCPVPPGPCRYGSQVPRSAGNLSVDMKDAERTYAMLVAAEALETVAAAAVEEASAAAGGGNAARAGPQAQNDKKGKKSSTGKRGWTKPKNQLPDGVTSLMLHGVPAEMTQCELLEEISLSGFAGKFDFFYMPFDIASGKRRGQAFVNFTSHGAAVEFHLAWRERPTRAGHVLNIFVAAQQGLTAQMANWSCPRRQRVRNPNYGPLVLGAGAAHEEGWRASGRSAAGL